MNPRHSRFTLKSDQPPAEQTKQQRTVTPLKQLGNNEEKKLYDMRKKQRNRFESSFSISHTFRQNSQSFPRSTVCLYFCEDIDFTTHKRSLF